MRKAMKERITRKLNKNGVPVNYTKPKSENGENKSLAQCLTELDPETNWTKIIESLGLAAADTDILIEVFYLSLYNGQPNSFKKLLARNTQEEVDEVIKLIQQVFDKATVLENYQEIARNYTEQVKQIQADIHHHGMLFKPVEYGTPEFTEAEFAENQLARFYDKLYSDFNSPAAPAALRNLLPNRWRSQKDGISLINAQVLERETLYDELFTPTEQEFLPDAIKQLTKEIKALTAEQRRYYKTIIKHRNRLILEYKYKDLCPKTNKFIYKITSQEFQSFRISSPDSKYRKLFKMSFDEFQKAASGKGRYKHLYEEFRREVEAAYKEQEKEFTELMERVQKHFFIPFQREPLSEKSRNLLANFKSDSEFIILPHGLEFASEQAMSDLLDKFDDLYKARQLNSKEKNLMNFIDRHFTGTYEAVICEPLSEGRIKEARSAATKTKNKDIKFGAITDYMGFTLVARNYMSAEKMMECIETIYRDKIIEKENLFSENRKDKAYRDVKYLIRINDYLCYELQIKVLSDKIIGETVEHDIYKGSLGLPVEKLDAVKLLIYGLQWQKHLELKKEYDEYYEKMNVYIESIHHAQQQHAVNAP
ncbi:hypothetical protein NO1_1769 [Candidatus Termititenax aidoneus]|uniref:RelA/SpoT domain-containing protein n=1 Tax=Termititenax aidoneus TaxID=2218524 RepID=A0A388TCQ4_TERA1|nr:hypothetical protein NO1_1769 [Candidatus Termititenax aidoneus]